jgi:hypothetical protein
MAQTLHGLTVGEALIPALKQMPTTQNFGRVGNYVAIKWTLSNGNSFSATASPVTGKIVLLEEDQDPASASHESLLPGLTLGATTLGDIRRRFGSNGIGFAANAETIQAGALIGINCYELRSIPGVFVAFVTRLSVSGQMGEAAPARISTGNGVLVSIIVAEKTYLQELWGTQLLFDSRYQRIDVPGLVKGD